MILRQEAAPALERWKLMQACMACLTLPRVPGESDDAFLARALTDSREQARKASERGSYLHGLLEQAIKNPALRASAADMAIIDPVLNWLSVNFGGYAWSPERSFAHPSGFGGKLDLYGTSGESAVVIDFKTKADINEKTVKELAYPEHVTQLAAYAYGLGAPIARCINLFIDVNVPNLIVPKEWTTEERDTGWQCFSHLLSLWKLRKGVT
jgi:hypothetical protein